MHCIAQTRKVLKIPIIIYVVEHNTYNNYLCENGKNYFFLSDLDECLQNPCNESANCTNTPGSFTCHCNTGYTGDGFSCDGKYISVHSDTSATVLILL